MRRLPSISLSPKKSASEETNYKPPIELGIVLIFIVMALIIFGIIMLYSTTANAYGLSLLTKQLMWTIVGIVLATLINIVGYNAIIPFSKYILVLTWCLLVIARFCREVNGAYRWIPLPGGVGNIQPSELAKIAIIMFLAYYIPKNQRKMKKEITAKQIDMNNRKQQYLYKIQHSAFLW